MRSRTVMVGILGALVLIAGMAPSASAGCADLTTTTGSVRTLAKMPVLRLAPLKALPAGAGVSAQPAAAEGPQIVGLWRFEFTSEGNTTFGIPDGASLDMGYAQWHSDGTEIMNSFRDPATSNFCLGVWAHTSGRTYTLNHWALSWDNTGMFCTPEPGKPSCFVGATNIRETVTVGASGDSYTGGLTIDQYNPDGSAIILTLHGTIAAQRIRPE